jgi:hypothetical protein
MTSVPPPSEMSKTLVDRIKGYLGTLVPQNKVTANMLVPENKIKQFTHPHASILNHHFLIPNITLTSREVRGV